MKQGDPDAITRVERETWDRNAARSLDSLALMTKHTVPILIDACQLTPDSHAIDIACGPGQIADMMAQTGASVTGIDLAPEMIRLAQKLYPAHRFEEANVERLPFEGDTFDAALINFSIHHFARPEMACSEVRRVLKPGGRLVFAGPIEPVGFGAFIEALDAHHTLDDLPHGPIYLDADQQTYETLMLDSGFDQFKVEIRQITLHLESLDPLIVAGWDICNLSTLPKETQEKIETTTREKTAPYRSSTGYDFPETVVIGIAVKS